MSHGWDKPTRSTMHHSHTQQITRSGPSYQGLPCTHWPTQHHSIKAPFPDLSPYLNHKQYHPINVQVIGYSQNHLLNVVSHFPGRVPVSYILQNGSGGEQGAAGEVWLIGKYQQWDYIMSWVIRRSWICLETWRTMPLTSPGAHSLKRRACDWPFKRTLDGFRHSRWQAAPRTREGVYEGKS